jgi:hypothetical protein
MALEFDCPNCQLRIQTPDETAGKQARCPRCLATSKIPYYSTPASPIRLVAAEIATPSSTSNAASQPNPFSDAFAPKVAAPVQSPSAANPYGRPNFEREPAQFPSRGEVRRRLFVPAIGLALMGLFGLALNGLGLAVTIAHMMEDYVSKDIGVAGMFATMIVPPLLMLIGAVAMFRGRGSRAAWAGAIAAVVPCSLGFPLSFLFGVWGLVVLMDPLADLVLGTKD